VSTPENAPRTPLLQPTRTKALNRSTPLRRNLLPKRAVAHVMAGALCVSCIGPLSEMIERTYEDTAAAKAAGAVGEGTWLPDILPDDARSIHEVHDIDTNETWGCFKTSHVNSMRSSTIAVLAYNEASAAPALSSRVIRVGIDVTSGTVCFYRK
jgi:hypothetical protein